MGFGPNLNRRQFLAQAGLLTTGALLPTRFALAQAQKIRVGLMLPYTGTYAQLGVAITNGVKNVVTLAWKYGAGEEATAGFSEGFIKAGGKSVRGLWVPFPNVEFQALLTEIASIKPDAVFVFFAGGGAAKFIKDYAAAGLRTKIPLFGSGFLTDGVLDAVEDAAQGLETTLHYGDGLQTKRDRDFRSAYYKAYTFNS